jgi:hypothetical protein
MYAKNDLSAVISKEEDGEEDKEEEEEDIKTKQDSTLLKDRYGFYINDEFHKSLDISPKEIKARLAKEKEREIKWGRMNTKGMDFLLKSRNNKFKSRIRKGIPNDIRSIWWPRLAIVTDIKVSIYVSITNSIYLSIYLFITNKIYNYK